MPKIMEIHIETSRSLLKKYKHLFLSAIFALAIILLLAVSTLPVYGAAPSGDYLITNPSVHEMHATSPQGNYLRLEVYGYQMDPSKEQDSGYDYYFFHIWATADAASNYCPTSWGISDPYGPTMQVVVEVPSYASFMTEYTKPKGYVTEPGATVCFDFGVSKSGASVGLSWCQSIPSWECSTTILHSDKIEWKAADNTMAWRWGQAWAWGFTVGVQVPQGKGFCEITTELWGSWFTGVWPIVTGGDWYGITMWNHRFEGWTANRVDPNGGRVFVDGNLITSPKTYAWRYHSNHKLDPGSGFSPSPGTRQVFTKWSDGNTDDPRNVYVTGSKAYVAYWKTQYYLTVSSPYATPTGQGWYDSGSTAHAGLDKGIVTGGSGTQYVFTYWSGDASGTNYAKSNPITMDRPKTANANWKTRYWLSVISNPSGIDNPRPSGWYDEGMSVTVRCDSPVSGGTGTQYVFTHWSGDASGTSTTTTVYMDRPKTAIANYKRQYYLTVKSNPSGIDNPRPSGWYDEGVTVTVQCDSPVPAGSATRYVFTHWSGDASGTSTTSSVYMNGPKTATANYKGQHYVTCSTNPLGLGGGVNPPSGWFDECTTVTFSVSTPIPSGPGTQYAFSHWSGDVSGTNPSVSVHINGPKNIVANYKLQYYLTVDSNPSGIDDPRPSGWYDEVTVVTVTCDTPVSCGTGCRWVFTHWSGDCSGTNPTTSVLMNGPKHCTANYKRQYELTIEAGVGGTTDPAPGSYWYDEGAAVVVDAVPDPCWKFDHWELDGSPAGTNPSITVHIDKDYTLKAIFEKIRCKLTIQISGTGTTDPSPGTYTHDCCTNVTVIANETDPDWKFDHWELDGSPAGTNPSITVHIDCKNHNLTAVFIFGPPPKCKLTIQVTGTGTTSPPPGDHTYDCCTNVTVTAIETDPCWRFDHWELDGANAGTDPSITVHMDKNYTLTAVFTKKRFELTIEVVGEGTTDPSPTPYEHDCCTNVTVTAIETDPCWKFDYWELDGEDVGSTNPYIIHMDKDHTLKAVFKQIQCEVTFYTDPAGPGFNITFQGQTYHNATADKFPCGTSGSAAANAPEDCVFDHWEVTGNVEVSNTTDNPTNVTITCGGTLKAVWICEIPKLYLDPSEVVGPPPGIGDTFTLTLKIDEVNDLYAWTVDITWDPTILEYVSVSEGDCLKYAGIPTLFLTGTITAGKIEGLMCTLMGVGSVDVPPGPNDLATITFKVLDYTCEVGTWINIAGSKLKDNTATEIGHTRENAKLTLCPCDLVVTDVELPYTEAKLYANITYDIGVNVTNLGSSSATTFNVALELFWVKGDITDYYAEKTVAGLGPGETTTVHFDVKITHAGLGYDYVLTATADCNDDVFESDETNNSMVINVDGRIPGDLNGDCKVDFDDIVAIAMAYMSRPDDPNWNEQADLDADGDVDFDDVVTAAMNYMKSCDP